MNINKAFKTAVLLLFVFAYAPIAHAAWKGPIEILSGKWGSETGEFYFEAGESGDSFPTKFGVDKNGLVVIPDEGNNRIVIYNPDGTINNTLHKPTSLPDLDNFVGWPIDFVLYPGGNSFVINCNYQKSADAAVVGAPLNKCILDYSGVILSKANTAQVFPIGSGYVFLNYQNNDYSFYSPTGQLINTSNTKPLELGLRTKQSMGGGDYKITIQYPEGTYSFVGSYMEYVRDSHGYINAIGTGTVTKINRCGKTIGQIKIPDTVYGAPQIIGKEKIPNYIAEYGNPVIAPNGDVYTWKRTPKKYSILKWTWKDDPKTSAACGEETNSKGK